MASAMMQRSVSKKSVLTQRNPKNIMDPNHYSNFLFCTSYFFLCLFVCSFMMVVAHNNLLSLQNQTPLKDFVHQFTPQLLGLGMELSEVCALSLLSIALLTLFIRSDRVLLWCRLATITGTVFLLRAASMFLTTIPIPHTAIECKGITASTPFEYLQRTVDVYLHGGLYLNGVKICGDYMFSGHTSGMTLLCLFICQYLPERFKFFKLIIIICNGTGVFFIICAREHYSVDILIALVICTLCFNYYHALVDARKTSSWVYPTYPYAEEFREANTSLYEWPLSRPAYLMQLTARLNTAVDKTK